MQVLFLVTDQRTEPFQYRTHNGYRRLIQHAHEAGFTIYVTGWESLLSCEDGIYLKRGVIIEPGGSEVPITSPLRCDPSYIWDGAIHGAIEIDARNLETFKFIIRHEILPNLRAGKNALGLRDIRITTENVDRVCDLLDQGLLPEFHVGSHSLTMRYLHYLRETVWKDTYWSRSFLLTTLGKYQLERYLRSATANGLPALGQVRRPKTWIAASKAAAVAELRRLIETKRVERLILKPSAGTRLEGILLLTPRNYEKQIALLQSGPNQHYVMQDYITDSVHYNGHKADIRIYVAVFSWAPLEYRVYRHGMTRVTGMPFAVDQFEDPANSLTTRKSYYTLQDYFADSCCSSQDSIWEEIERTVEATLKSLLHGEQELNLLHRTIPYLGFDILLRESDGRVEAWLLEVNHAPMLYTDKLPWEHAVNQRLDQTHGQFFQDLRKFLSPNLSDSFR